jgi:catechol 2,3-dioxygenase-like lactoylglutathione lyase family enzyme
VIDHVVLSISDFQKSRRFYAGALAPLGYRVVKEFPGWAGFGAGARADIWIATREPVTASTHVALLCGTRSLVDAFHEAALKAGGRDNGAPGLRPDYHPDYYGAFVLDPDGNNIEAICHEPAMPEPKRR